jgi:hypothetical protein
MRAVTVERYGGIDAMQMSNTLLRPTEPGPTEVIVRVYAAAINPVDVSRREGKLEALLHDSFPFVPGKQHRSIYKRNLLNTITVQANSSSLAFSHLLQSCHCYHHVDAIGTHVFVKGLSMSVVAHIVTGTHVLMYTACDV